MLGYPTGGAYRERFYIAAIDPADDIGPGVPNLEPTADPGTQQFHPVDESEGGEYPVAGAGTGTQGQPVDVDIIIGWSRPDGQGCGRNPARSRGSGRPGRAAGG